ncbi:MAG TPA: response regulator transcription factor [Gammaproteobacteria bacterium]|nr:response regulator transcription factor [Gammaproteobacteria bacterium]HVC27954.1 response regulator transcription factor [Gammaproteobacteria bacterium]
MNTSCPVDQIRVVVADDNPYFMECVCQMLSKHEWLQVVGAAANSDECLALVAKLRPDVVVLDLEIPEINGFEIAKRIKSLSSKPRIIILSLYDEPEYREGGQNLGVYGYVSKAEVSTDLIPLLQSLSQERESRTA